MGVDRASRAEGWLSVNPMIGLCGEGAYVVARNEGTKATSVGSVCAPHRRAEGAPLAGVQKD